MLEIQGPFWVWSWQWKIKDNPNKVILGYPVGPMFYDDLSFVARISRTNTIFYIKIT